tara:strand:- start:184 stop:354 length:171 start_codon:yes stop_codon:yes gene_type:complete
MIINPNTEAGVVYITIKDATFYIDYSMNEPIVEMWKDKETEVVTLLPEVNDTHTED